MTSESEKFKQEREAAIDAMAADAQFQADNQAWFEQSIRHR